MVQQRRFGVDVAGGSGVRGDAGRGNVFAIQLTVLVIEKVHGEWGSVAGVSGFARIRGFEVVRISSQWTTFMPWVCEAASGADSFWNLANEPLQCSSRPVLPVRFSLIIRDLPNVL